MSVNRMRSRPRGFTLLEILIVLLVIGLASALLYPRLDPSPARTLQRDAAHLAAALESTAKLAQWRGKTLGMSIESAGYRVWERDEAKSRWLVTTDDSLAPRSFDAGTTLAALSVGGVSIPSRTVVVFRPSGRNEPVSVVLTSGAATARLRTDFMNRVAFSLVAGG